MRDFCFAPFNLAGGSHVTKDMVRRGHDIGRMRSQVELAGEQGYTFEVLCENSLTTTYSRLIEQMRTWRELWFPNAQPQDFEFYKMVIAVVIILSYYEMQPSDLQSNCKQWESHRYTAKLFRTINNNDRDTIRAWVRTKLGNHPQITPPNLCCLLSLDPMATPLDGVGNLFYNTGVPPPPAVPAEDTHVCMSCRNVLEQAYHEKANMYNINVYSENNKTIQSVPIGSLTNMMDPDETVFLSTINPEDRQKFYVIRPEAPIRWVFQAINRDPLIAGKEFKVTISTRKYKDKTTWDVPPGYDDKMDASYRAREYYQHKYDRLKLMIPDEAELRREVSNQIPYWVDKQDEMSYTLTRAEQEKRLDGLKTVYKVTIISANGDHHQVEPGYVEEWQANDWARSYYQRKYDHLWKSYYHTINTSPIDDVRIKTKLNIKTVWTDTEATVPFNYDYSTTRFDIGLVRPYRGHIIEQHESTAFVVDRTEQERIWNWKGKKHYVYIYNSERKPIRLSVWYPDQIDERTVLWYQQRFDEVSSIDNQILTDDNIQQTISTDIVFFGNPEGHGLARPTLTQGRTSVYHDLEYAVNLPSGVHRRLIYSTAHEAISAYDKIFAKGVTDDVEMVNLQIDQLQLTMAPSKIDIDPEIVPIFGDGYDNDEEDEERESGEESDDDEEHTFDID